MKGKRLVWLLLLCAVPLVPVTATAEPLAIVRAESGSELGYLNGTIVEDLTANVRFSTGYDKANVAYSYDPALHDLILVFAEVDLVQLKISIPAGSLDKDHPVSYSSGDTPGDQSPIRVVFLKDGQETELNPAISSIAATLQAVKAKQPSAVADYEPGVPNVTGIYTLKLNWTREYNPAGINEPPSANPALHAAQVILSIVGISEPPSTIVATAIPTELDANYLPAGIVESPTGNQ